jgi:hypothetical protein
LQYTVLPYNTDIPESAGLNIFFKGLAKLEIDKSLIANGRVLTMLAHKQPLHDVDTQSDKSEDESEDVDTACNSCNRYLYISHLGTCPVCTWTDFYPNCKRCQCMICDFRLYEGNFTHVIASCQHCYCDEIMDVSNLVPRAFCFGLAKMALASAGHMTSKSPVFGVFNYDNLCV